MLGHVQQPSLLMARILSHAAASASHTTLLGASQRQLLSSTSRPIDDAVKSAFGYCVQQVKTYDYDNYVWMAQLPKEHRPAMFAVRAFNVETALVADQVKSKEGPVLQIRYQWWRDGVTSSFRGNPPPHPVLLALREIVSNQQMRHGQTHRLGKDARSSSGDASPSTSSSPFAAGGAQAGDGKAGDSKPSPVGIKAYNLKRMIDTREADMLDTQPPLGVDALERYAEGTASQLLYLQLAAVGVQSREADHAASHLGKAVGLTTLLRGAMFHASQRRSYMPIDLCAKHGVSQEEIYAGGSASEGLRDVVLAVASVAKGHLDEARALAPHLPRGAASVMLPALGCDRYLQALEREAFDVFSPKLQPRGGQAAPLSYVLQVKYSLLMGRY